jgi:SAM-dependent methyltransferase
MTLAVGCNARCAYQSGRLPDGAGWLSHPGGLDLTRHAIEMGGLGCGARVLDIGCGSGQSVRYLLSLGIKAVGVDQADDSETASTPPGARVVASTEQLPFADASMDAVLAECSLSVMRNPRKVMSECARVLRTGGQLIISDLYARNPGDIAAVRELKSACVSGMLVREELESWLHDAGFETQCFEDHSRALCDAVAHFLFEHDSTDELWSSDGEISAQEISTAMKQVRAGYFLLIATRGASCAAKNGGCRGR